jgi:hypothetical protein
VPSIVPSKDSLLLEKSHVGHSVDHILTPRHAGCQRATGKRQVQGEINDTNESHPAFDLSFSDNTAQDPNKDGLVKASPSFYRYRSALCTSANKILRVLDQQMDQVFTLMQK